MNVYLFEIRKNLKFAISWLIAIYAIAFIYMAFYPTFAEDLNNFVGLLDNYPEGLKVAIGMNVDSLDNIIAYFATIPLTFITLFSSISAMILGVSVLSKEARNNTADFLMTKPMSRLNIFLAKLLAALTLLFLMNVDIFIFLLIIISLFSNVPFSITTLALLTLTVLIIQIIFLGIGLLISILMKKIKNPIFISVGVVFGFYFLSSFGDDKLRFIMPFKYFDSTSIIETNKYDIVYLTLAISIFIICSLITYFIYRKKDIPSV